MYRKYGIVLFRISAILQYCTILSAKKSNFLPGQVVWFEGLLCNLVGVGLPFPSWKGGQVLHTADSFTGHAKMQQNAFYISLLQWHFLLDNAVLNFGLNLSDKITTFLGKVSLSLAVLFVHCFLWCENPVGRGFKLWNLNADTFFTHSDKIDIQYTYV